MCVDGLGAKEIARTLNGEGLRTIRNGTWNKNGIYYILKNPVYTGTLVWGRHGKRKPGCQAAEEPTSAEGAHEPLVDEATFKQVQALLKARSPRVRHPRTVNSDFLLSGLLYCGKCGATMAGCSGKSSRYHYYSCRTYQTRGRGECAARRMNREKLDGFVIDRIRENILTGENLEDLVRLANEEAAQSRDASGDRLDAIDKQLGGLRKRLGKLCDALETGKLDLDVLAPRMTDLKAQVDALETTRAEVKTAMDGDGAALLSPAAVKAQAKDLQALLSAGSIIERKTFIASLVKRIEFDGEMVTVEYTIPLRTARAEPPNVEVLPIDLIGSPPREQTILLTLELAPPIAVGW